MSDAEYAAAKAAAKAPASPKPTVSAGSAPLTQIGPNFVGDSVGGPGGTWAPSNVHGAVGNQQFVQVTNSDVSAWSLASPTPTLLFNASLNSFFGDGTTSNFDPRVVYHPIYNRWIITAPEFPNGTDTVQELDIAVSNSPNAAGGYYFYTINTMDSAGAGTFYDYPQIGFDHDSLIITANIFEPFSGAQAQFWPLAELTSGLPAKYFYFNGLAATLAPPLVYDRNQKAFLVAAGSPSLTMYAATETSRDPVLLSAPANIPVAAWSIPPNASQNSATDQLDTLDGRFQNASTQIGKYLYQVHSRDLGPVAAVEWFKIDTSTNTNVKQCTTSASASSHDFNPSIA
ncbi:MAG: hypothetical protein ACRDV9_02620, partial [Acidimicrobiia bacterium]